MDGIIKFCAQYLIAAVAIILIYIFFKIPKKQRLQMLIGLVLAVIVAGILDKIAGKLYYDPRPFVSHSVKPLIAHAPDNGFPSEHTIAAMTISTFIYFYRKKFAMMAFILTLIIGAARVAAHVHSPIDIIGGLVIGTAAGWTGFYLAPKVTAILKR
jgi:undecaprenyl-diphosphatase